MLDPTSRRLRIVVATVALIASSTGGAQTPQVEIRGFSAKLVAQEVLSGHLKELNSKYKMAVSQFTYEPGGYLGPHHHAGPGFRCVLSGEVTSVEADKKTVYRAGDCYWEPGDNAHTAKNEGDKPAVGLLIEILPESLSGSSILPVPAFDVSK